MFGFDLSSIHAVQAWYLAAPGRGVSLEPCSMAAVNGSPEQGLLCTLYEGVPAVNSGPGIVLEGRKRIAEGIGKDFFSAIAAAAKNAHLQPR